MRAAASSARFLRASSQGTVSVPARALAARSITAGAAPLTKMRTTLLPAASVAEVNAAMSL